MSLSRPIILIAMCQQIRNTFTSLWKSAKVHERTAVSHIALVPTVDNTQVDNGKILLNHKSITIMIN